MSSYAQIVDDARNMDLTRFLATYRHPFLFGWRILGGSLTKRTPVTAGYMRRSASGVSRRGAANSGQAGGVRKESTLVYKTQGNVGVAQNPLADDSVQSCELERPYVFVLVRSDGKPGPVVIGRTVDADVTINDYSVSGTHAQFATSEETGFSILQDLGSTNGTAVGTQRLESGQTEMLQSGYWITLGRIVCQYFTRKGLFDHANSPPE